MKKFKITGGNLLSGTIRISGAKNAIVALIPASILSDEGVTICNVPEISDVDALEELLTFLNVDVKRATNSMIINPANIKNRPLPDNITKKLRASYYLMGALLAKFRKVEISLPGGCEIGKRPIDLHLEGFKKLGVDIAIEEDKYILTAKELKGAKIHLDVASVGATINIILAATKAVGTTIIKNAAKEPEIVNLVALLNNMGADIKGAGTSVIKIKGVKSLSKGFVEVIPDRIEAGTYIILGSLIGKDLKIDNIVPEHIKSLTDKLQESKADIKINKDNIICNKKDNLFPVDIQTDFYPGFPTDLQQPFNIYSTQCNGRSIIEENIYENRFMHIEYLNKMGANIKIDHNKAYINGPTKLKGRKVLATDLRAGAALLIAGLIAEEETEIENIEHILRGYDEIVEKLTNVGAKIELI